MPNQFNLRARMDNLWRQSGDHNPGYIRLRALGAIVRELYAPTEQARLNQQLCFATDPYDVARHKLRDLYDGPQTSRRRGRRPDRGGGGRPLRRRDSRGRRRPFVTANLISQFGCQVPRVFFFSRITRTPAPPCPPPLDARAGKGSPQPVPNLIAAADQCSGLRNDPGPASARRNDRFGYTHLLATPDILAYDALVSTRSL